MSYRDCLGCEKAGTKPKRGKGITVVFDPRMMMPGPPTIEGHRLGAESMAAWVWKFGIASGMSDYELSREELLVACWWAGRFGPRKWRKRWEQWAMVLGQHLWYGCIQTADPPTEEPA